MGCAERRASSCLSRPRKYSVFSSSGQAFRISSPILRSCVDSYGEAILQSGNIAKCCNTGLWNLLLLTRTVHKLPLRSTSVVTALQTNGSLQWPKETPSSSFGGAHPGASNANTSRGSYRIRSGLRIVCIGSSCFWPLSRVSSEPMSLQLVVVKCRYLKSAHVTAQAVHQEHHHPSADPIEAQPTIPRAPRSPGRRILESHG